MQNRLAIIRSPIVPALLLSIAVHAVLLHSRGTHQMDAQPIMRTGKTVVHLTLKPSIASPSIPEPIQEPPVKEEVAPTPTPIPTPVAPPKQPVQEIKHEAIEETAPEAPPPSIEQDASIETEKGVSAEAALSGTFSPAYPRISRRRNEEGTVTLSLHVLSNGSIDQVSIIKSSGYRRLDEAALKGAKQATFTPALQDGQPIDSTTEISFTFRLTND